MKGLQHHPVFTTVTAASLSQRTVMRSPVQRPPYNSKATTMLKVSKNRCQGSVQELKAEKHQWKYWS